MIAAQDIAMTDVQHNKSGEAQEECEARYERMDKLGEGTYGIVYKSRDRDTNEVMIEQLF